MRSPAQVADGLGAAGVVERWCPERQLIVVAGNLLVLGVVIGVWCWFIRTAADEDFPS